MKYFLGNVNEQLPSLCMFRFLTVILSCILPEIRLLDHVLAYSYDFEERAETARACVKILKLFIYQLKKLMYSNISLYQIAHKRHFAHFLLCLP